jgi:D-alanyl-lipoteichoic acid acyltransferase DltB (MBOAT superfamily)
VNLLFIGYLKKVLFADNFAPFVERVFAHPSAHNRWMCVVAAYGYSMQVYFDFSAYSDLASGCAKLLGYDLPENFDKPYLATGIADFWRRWHKSLSRWLRDYLYIPLGGNQGSRLSNYRNLFLTMLLGGLWHGAKWTFVAWGALNGVFLLLEKAYYDLRGRKPKRIEAMSPTERLVRRVIVFHLITFTRIFFRAPSFAIATELVGQVVRPTVLDSEAQIGLWLIPAASIGFVLVSPLRKRLLTVDPGGRNLVGYALALVALLVFGASQAEFIYFQF